ncbi:MAG: hypothetical protein Q9161_003841 [Pseudevernia consocians]
MTLTRARRSNFHFVSDLSTSTGRATGIVIFYVSKIDGLLATPGLTSHKNFCVRPTLVPEEIHIHKVGILPVVVSNAKFIQRIELDDQLKSLDATKVREDYLCNQQQLEVFRVFIHLYLEHKCQLQPVNRNEYLDAHNLDVFPHLDTIFHQGYGQAAGFQGGFVSWPTFNAPIEWLSMMLVRDVSDLSAAFKAIKQSKILGKGEQKTS